MFRSILLAAPVLLLGCDVEFQDTSGRSFLASRAIDEPGLVTSASYEPNLRFPARTGMVRLVYGEITAAPQAERDLFAQVFDKRMGEVTLIGPLEAQLSGVRGRILDQQKIRKLAATRHLDYLLVVSYDPGSERVETLFLDVRNGYPYASIERAGDGRGKTNFWGGRIRNQKRLNAQTLRLATEMKPNLVEMLDGLLGRGS